MSQETAMKINKLPAPTWNWLRMNEARIERPALSREGSVKIEKPQAIRELREESLEQEAIEKVSSGMGADMEALARKSPAALRVFESPAGVREEEPLRLGFSYGENAADIDRIGLVAREGSDLFVIMDFAGEKDAAGTAIVQTKLRAEKDARIRLVQIQRTEGLTFYNDIGADCAEGGSVELTQIVLGGHSTYVGARARLAGVSSSFSGDVGYLLEEKDRLDMNYVMAHTGRKTNSKLDVSGVLRDEAFKLFRGTIDFQNGSGGSKGDEKEDVLLLSDGVVNQTIPLILCQEEDVEGNHGATIGKLDEELLFYLESRGMGEEQVYEMLARARIDAVCRKLHDERTAALVREYLEKKSGASGENPEEGRERP